MLWTNREPETLSHDMIDSPQTLIPSMTPSKKNTLVTIKHTEVLQNFRESLAGISIASNCAKQSIK